MVAENDEGKVIFELVDDQDRAHVEELEAAKTYAQSIVDFLYQQDTVKALDGHKTLIACG